ncbi:unnamed protein product [Chrysoparadoxa australica]
MRHSCMVTAGLVSLCSFAMPSTDAARGTSFRKWVGSRPDIPNPDKEADPGTTGGRIGTGGIHLGNLPKVTVDETIEPEDQEIREEQRRGRWTFINEEDPIVQVIKSVKDLFPQVRFSCEPTSTIKLRKRICPLKTVMTLGADYNTNIGVWQFRSSWEDSIIGGRISVAGRELILSKSWLIKILDSEDVATRLKFRAAVNTRDWTAYAKFGFRTESIRPLNVKEGFSLCKRFPLDGNSGHTKLELVASVALPEPEIQFSTDGDHSRGVVAGMGDVQVGLDELNLLLEY